MGLEVGGGVLGGGHCRELFFDVYLRVDYRQQGNMELGLFEVGKHKQEEKYNLPLLWPRLTLCQVVIKS